MLRRLVAAWRAYTAPVVEPAPPPTPPVDESWRAREYERGVWDGYAALGNEKKDRHDHYN